MDEGRAFEGLEPRYAVGKLGAVVASPYDHTQATAARLDMIERRILRIEKIMNQQTDNGWGRGIIDDTPLEL